MKQTENHIFNPACHSFLCELKNIEIYVILSRNMGFNHELVSIHSEQEQSFLKTILAQHDTNPDIIYEFWIGFHDFVHWNYDEMGTYIWSDESSVDYVNWASGEPSSNYEEGKECVQMWAHDDFDIGHWNDRGCENKMPFICKTRASQDINEPPATPKCQGKYGDYDKFTNGCYKWIEESLTWTEAENRCQNMENSHILSILKESENAYAMVTARSEMIWTGLSNKMVCNLLPLLCSSVFALVFPHPLCSVCSC